MELVKNIHDQSYKLRLYFHRRSLRCYKSKFEETQIFVYTSIVHLMLYYNCT